MLFTNPPHTNGVMELTEEEILDIQDKLKEIESEFTPTIECPVCDLFYLTAKYNEENDMKINGDTASMVLSSAVLDSEESQEIE